ncbi:protein containing Serine dehydratase alpha chain domain protein, partial [gut metagenome]
MDQHICSCSLVEGVANLYIVAKVSKGEHFAEVTIVNHHTNITKIVKDGEVLLDSPVEAEDTDAGIDKSTLTVKDILTFADEVEIQDVQEILERQIRMNSAIAQEGLDNNYGAQIGKTLMHVWGKGITTRACARAAAGSDARMGGCSMPVVINSGSGNQGMTVSLPVIAYAEEWEVSREKLYRSLVVSNLIAIHQKFYIGSLSAYCGAVSAACGAGAGITYMYGGTYQQVSLTIINTLGNIGGIVCDGAKPSCAAKIASS